MSIKTINQRLKKNQLRNYQNKTYSRIAIYPKTHETIKLRAKKSGKTMMDWLDEKVNE